MNIASRSWQAVDNQTPGTTLCHDSIAAFLRDTHAVAARTGAVDMNLLLLDERPIAFAYNYHYQGHLYGLRVGYDLEAGKDGVGNLLYVHAIRDSFARGDHTYDMGPGSLAAKQYLLTSVLDIGRYSHYWPTAIRAQLVRLKRAWARRAESVPQPG
ncbi:MAG: GNAT family N-acetyltransferase [Planctomycetes bacterium]|nr:GNAT family N-acetyltransferase [Planctomycetota bacterium]